MADQRVAVGRLGEDLAVAHLRAAGYRIIERNVRTRLGEIDIVALDGSCIVFVEVRTTRWARTTPEESIGRTKKRRLGALGEQYLQAHGQSAADWRADVIAVELEPDGKQRRLEHYVSAIEAVS